MAPSGHPCTGAWGIRVSSPQKGLGPTLCPCRSLFLAHLTCDISRLSFSLADQRPPSLCPVSPLALIVFFFSIKCLFLPPFHPLSFAHLIPPSLPNLSPSFLGLSQLFPSLSMPNLKPRVEGLGLGSIKKPLLSLLEVKSSSTALLCRVACSLEDYNTYALLGKISNPAPNKAIIKRKLEIKGRNRLRH